MAVLSILVIIAMIGLYGLVCWLFKDELIDQYQSCKAQLARTVRSKRSS